MATPSDFTSIGSAQALNALLVAAGIDTSSWGREHTKSVADLWAEMVAGESHIRTQPLLRVVLGAGILLCVPSLPGCCMLNWYMKSFQVRYELEGTDSVEVTPDLVYKAADGRQRLMDVYRPAGADQRLPAVIMVHGSGPQFLVEEAKDWGNFTGMGRILAASGLVGVAFNHRGSMSFETLDAESARRLGYSRRARGVLITDVKPGSPADDAGLQPGDLIIQVERVNVRTLEELESLTERLRRDTVLLLVQRGRQAYYVALPRE